MSLVRGGVLLDGCYERGRFVGASRRMHLDDFEGISVKFTWKYHEMQLKFVPQPRILTTFRRF